MCGNCALPEAIKQESSYKMMEESYRQTYVASKRSQGDIDTCLAKLSDPSFADLKLTLGYLPAWMDAMRSESVVEVKNAFLVAVTEYGQQLQREESSEIPLGDFLLFAEEVEQVCGANAQGLAELMPELRSKQTESEKEAICKKILSSIEQYLQDDYFPENASAQLEAYKPFLSMLPTLDGNAVSASQEILPKLTAAAWKLLEAACAIAARVVEASTDATAVAKTASQVFAGLSQLGRFLLQVQSEGAADLKTQLAAVNPCVQLSSLLAEQQQQAEEDVANDKVATQQSMQMKVCLDRYKSVPAKEPFSKHLSSLVEASSESVNSVRQQVHEAATKDVATSMQKLRGLMGLSDGVAVAKVVWWKDLGQQSSLQDLMQLGEKTVMKETYAKSLKNEHSKADQVSQWERVARHGKISQRLQIH